MPRAKRWKSLPWGRTRVEIEYRLRRVQCRHCGVHVEKVPWADVGRRFTRDFEEMVAYLAQITDKTTVTRLMGLSWRAVGTIVAGVVARRMDPDRLKDLRCIGIDEFSYRKRHHYITVVVDHIRHKVIWAAEGRGAETLDAFFDELGPEGIDRLEAITIDMAGGYLKSIEERGLMDKVVFDRFHVQRLASDAVDEVRRHMWRELKGTDEGKAIKGTRFSLLRGKWNLNTWDKMKLADIQRNNQPLYRAYLLKEMLAKILSSPWPKHAARELNSWLWWASHSRLEPFKKAARTIRKHKAGILAYLRVRLTNGIVEGINTHLRMIARRAYGFHSAEPLISMLFLCAGGIQLNPPLPTVAW
jgi:transposase